jgi:hypothetical protein
LADAQRSGCGNQVQQQRQEYRHRVIEPGLDLEQGEKAFRQRSTGAPQQHRDRRRVSRRRGGTGEQRSDQRHAFDPGDENTDNDGGQCDADRGQHGRRPEREAEHGERRLEPALEQNHRERDTVDQVGRREVVVRNAKHVIVAREHAGREEDEQHRRADATRDHPGDDTQQPEYASRQDQLVRLRYRLVAVGDQFGAVYAGCHFRSLSLLIRRSGAKSLDERRERVNIAAPSGCGRVGAMGIAVCRQQ